MWVLHVGGLSGERKRILTEEHTNESKTTEAIVLKRNSPGKDRVPVAAEEEVERPLELASAAFPV